MWQVCMFGGYEGQLVADRKVYLTIFGGCDLVRTTLARRIIHARQHRDRADLQARWCVVVTVFGGTDIAWPTLAEEFIDFKSMIDARMLSLANWDRDLAELHRVEEAAITTFTLFGGLDDDALPNENKEIDALALQRHLGNIPESAGKILELGIGRSGAQRYAAIRKAVAAAV